MSEKKETTTDNTLENLKGDVTRISSENEALVKSNETLKKENEALKKELKDAMEIVSDLKNQVKSSKGGKSNTIKVGNSTYAVIGGYRTKTKTYTAEDIAADVDIAKSLIKKGSGLIKKIK